jgi:hypothetical protein
MKIIEAHMKIKVNAYPQLQVLCWNRANDAVIDGAEALELYERNWRFVEQDALTADERQLLETLVADYGHGVLLVA